MGIRSRLKRMTSNRSGSNTPSDNSPPKIEFYKPGEEPKLKYRGKIDKEHSDKLHAFSFSDAWNKRKSSDSHGAMSPGGTMAQSRAASIIGSMRKKSVASGSGSDADNRDIRRKSVVAQPDTETVKESSVDDTDVANAGGLSRPQTASGKPPEPGLAKVPVQTNGVPLQKTEAKGGLNPSHDVPFQDEELEKAMTRTTPEAPDRVVSEGVAAH